MDPKCAACPVAGDGECRAYAHLCRRMGESPELYGPLVSRLNAAVEPTPPTAAEMAAGLARSLRDWAVSGFGLAGEEAVRRMEICRACDHFEAGRCKLCGCFLPLKTKLGTSKCPVGKW